LRQIDGVLFWYRCYEPDFTRFFDHTILIIWDRVFILPVVSGNISPEFYPQKCSILQAIFVVLRCTLTLI
jgi:hypothetical protein